MTEGVPTAATIRRLPGPPPVHRGPRPDPEPNEVGQHGPSFQGHHAEGDEAGPQEGGREVGSRDEEGVGQGDGAEEVHAAKTSTAKKSDRQEGREEDRGTRPRSRPRRRPHPRRSRSRRSRRRRRPPRRPRRRSLAKKAAAAKKAPPAKAAVKKAAAAPKKAPMKTANKPTPHRSKAAPKPPPVKKEPPPKKLPPPLAQSTLDKLRELLDEARASHARQAEELEASAEQLASEREQGDTQFDEESGEGDTVERRARARPLALGHRPPDRRRHRSRPANASPPACTACASRAWIASGRTPRGHSVGRAVREVQGSWRTASLRREAASAPGRGPSWVVAALAAHRRDRSADEGVGRLRARRRTRSTSSATSSSSKSPGTAAAPSAASRATRPSSRCSRP